MSYLRRGLNLHRNVRWHKADGQQKTLEKGITRESSCLFSFFGVFMAENKIREQIVKAAYQYSLLANKIYMYICGEQYFELLFAVGCFRHLTGVASSLSAEDFYKNALNKSLTDKQIQFTPRQTMKKAKKKLPCLIRLPELTDSTVCIVRDMKTNTLVYKLGLTNLEFTLGVAQPTFVNKFPENVYIPRSLRVKDKAIENSDSGEFVDFILEKNLDNIGAKYSKITYRDKGKAFPDVLLPMLDENMDV